MAFHQPAHHRITERCFHHGAGNAHDLFRSKVISVAACGQHGFHSGFKSLQQAFRQPQNIWSGRERSKKQEQVMKANQRLCVAAELGPARSGERADDFPLVDCADLRPCLFQLVEQPGCFVCWHELTRTFLPQRTRRTQRRKKILTSNPLRDLSVHCGRLLAIS
jgi:hypothetical protein